jgi:hypothetical protein
VIYTFILSCLSLIEVMSLCLAVLLFVQLVSKLIDDLLEDFMTDGIWTIRRFSKYEYCIGCKTRTDIPKDLDITLRRYYIEGSGQLCKKCYELVYNTTQ